MKGFFLPSLSVYNHQINSDASVVCIKFNEILLQWDLLIIGR